MWRRRTVPRLIMIKETQETNGETVELLKCLHFEIVNNRSQGKLMKDQSGRRTVMAMLLTNKKKRIKTTTSVSNCTWYSKKNFIDVCVSKMTFYLCEAHLPSSLRREGRQEVVSGRNFKAALKYQHQWTFLCIKQKQIIYLKESCLGSLTVRFKCAVLLCGRFSMWVKLKVFTIQLNVLNHLVYFMSKSVLFGYFLSYLPTQACVIN